MSNVLQWRHACYSFVVLVLLGIGLLGQLANGQVYRVYGNKKFAYYSITVDQSGRGNFTSIQSAIDAVPSNNKNWVAIKIRAGTYREKVTIPREKPYIILKGENKRKTQIAWGDHESTADSYTFASFANNTVVKSISFVNSYNNPVNRNPTKAAVAALIAGDKSTFYRCRFFGFQDTLWDASGRHYYKSCTIQGAVDFIFGKGQSIFEGCVISVLAETLNTNAVGFITAQGRDNADDSSGFVFKYCRVFGTGSTFLGRPWGSYSRVVFYNSYLSNFVVPEGWSPWNTPSPSLNQITYAEHGCYGPGADTSRRVSWEQKLSPSALQQLTSMSFIDSEGWLRDQPL